jgi:hypothetical protein
VVAKRQREYERKMLDLQAAADRQRSALEGRTARQQQQLKEALGLAKKYGDEKRKYVAMHRELEMLNAERVREAVEHATLMKEISKMDAFVLSQMSTGSRVRPAATGSTTARGTRF